MTGKPTHISEEIEGILDKYLEGVQDKVSPIEEVFTEAAQAIQKLIDSAVVEARIDELEMIDYDSAYKGGIINTDKDGESRSIRVRIDQLKALQQDTSKGELE